MSTLIITEESVKQLPPNSQIYQPVLIFTEEEEVTIENAIFNHSLNSLKILPSLKKVNLKHCVINCDIICQHDLIINMDHFTRQHFTGSMKYRYDEKKK